MLLVAFLQVSAASLSVVGPTNTCQSSTNTYTASYLTVQSPIGNEMVSEIRWTFSQDGQIINTLYSASFPVQSNPLPASVSVTAPSFPTGIVHLEVRLKVVMMPIIGLPTIGYNYANLDITVGPLKPAFVSGPSILYPGSTTTFSTTAVAGAQTYQWVVPSSWKVNGVNGPMVTTSIPSANITLPPCAYTNILGRAINPPLTPDTIKLRAVGACGVSAASTRIVNADAQVQINVIENSVGTTTFEASNIQLPAYRWMSPFPDGWYQTYQQGYQITFNTYQLSGTIRMRYQVDGGCVYGTEKYYVYSSPPCCGGGIQVYPIPASKTLNLRHDKGSTPQLFIDGMSIQYQTQQAHDIQIDISSLSTGPHILLIRGSDGENRAIRFVKVSQ